MRKNIKTYSGILTVVPAALLLLAGGNAAAQPVFDNWSVEDGTITGAGGTGVPCAAGFSCEVVSSGDGFAQVQWVETATGTTYIQTIITDLGAGAGAPTDPSALPYRDENFVQLGAGNGIMSQQIQQQSDAAGDFETTSALMIGWANTAPGIDNPNVSIDQTFTSDGTAVAGDEFNTVFNLELVNDGGAVDRSITIDQTAGLGDGVTASDDEQRFLLERRAGAFTPDPGEIALGATSFDAGGTPLNGGTVAWAAGDDVMVRWIGQAIDTQGASEFGFEGVTNFTSDEDATTFSQNSAGIDPDGAGGFVAPFDWDDTFGTAPQL